MTVGLKKTESMEETDQPELSSASLAQEGDVGLFIELGGQGPAAINRLKRGAGALTQQVHAAVDRWRDELGIDPNTEVVPVVMLYRRNSLK